MVISGLNTGKRKTNTVISMACNSSAQNSTPAQPGHHNQANQNDNVRMRSGRKIVRENETEVRNNENVSTSSRKRHLRQEPTLNSENKRRNVVLRRANYGRQRGTSSSSEEGPSEDFTKKRSILFWLVDSGVIPPDAQLFYMNMSCEIILRRGRITPHGLLCDCCHRIVTLSEFEIHAGSKLKDPHRNIFFLPHVNLLTCQELAWKRQDESALCSCNIIEDENESDQNDDTCGTCGDGGDLICCDGCPSTYHQSCMNIQVARYFSMIDTQQQKKNLFP